MQAVGVEFGLFLASFLNTQVGESAWYTLFAYAFIFPKFWENSVFQATLCILFGV